MQYSIKHLIIGSLFIFTVAGCSKGGGSAPVVVPDTTKPTITITSPAAGTTFSAGNNIPFQATFADNVALQSYSVTVSQKVLGGLALKVVPTSVPFTYTKATAALSGKSQVITLSDINIPANSASTIVTSGVYNLKVTCTDSSNNSATPITIEITIN